MYKYLIYIIFIAGISTGFAQTKKGDHGKKIKDFFTIKAPAINYIKPDTAYIEGEFEKKGTDSGVEFYFDPERLKNPYVDVQDSNRVNEEDFSIVEVDEEIRVDSAWVKIASYYSIWDSRSVNPYKIDATKFNDTLYMRLYDSSVARYWHPPLAKGKVNDDFGPRKYRWHYGVDLELDTGDSVFAVFDGIVRIRKYDGGGYGFYVLIRHYNGLETIYGHLSKQLVEVGQLVKAGDLIGWGGSTGRSTGPHLHFETRYQGNPIDPEDIFDFGDNAPISDVFALMPSHFNYLKQVRRVFFHRVKRGDTLLEIADRYNVSLRALMKMNRISARTTLKPGRRLRIR